MQSTYFGWPGRFLFMGRGGRSALHAHAMLQLVVSQDRPVRVRQQATDTYGSYEACLIAPHASHQVVMTNRSAPGFMLWLDIEMFPYEQPPDAITPITLPYSLRAQLQDAAHSCQSAEHIATLLTELIRPLATSSGLDPRINAVCEAIKAAVVGARPIVLDDLADAVFLSPSRLMHLFKAEMGFTVRRYVLWQRKLRAMELLSDGLSLTETAHAAGFADSAHLTRTYRQMSGVAPSEIWQNSRFVQVRNCTSI